MTVLGLADIETIMGPSFTLYLLHCRYLLLAQCNDAVLFQVIHHGQRESEVGTLGRES